jgi:L-asparagine transporter-like permease
MCIGSSGIDYGWIYQLVGVIILLFNILLYLNPKFRNWKLWIKIVLTLLLIFIGLILILRGFVSGLTKVACL